MLIFLQTFLSRHEIYKTGKTSKTGKTLLKKLDFSMGLWSYQGLTFSIPGKTFSRMEAVPAQNQLT